MGDTRVSRSIGKREIIDRIHAHAAATPARNAIECGDQAITYRTLVERLGIRLQSLSGSVRQSAFVPIDHPRSVEFVVDFLAVLALDGVPVPIDPALPARRREALKKMISRDHAVADGDGAYVFFTSGSTGGPKPVLGSAAALRSFLEWQCAEFGIGSGDRVAFLTAMSFDVAVRDIFLPLWAGGTLVIPAPAEADSPEAAVAWLESRRVSVVNVVPSVARSWLRHGRDRCLSVRTVFFAGEPLSGGLVDAWHGMFPNTSCRVNFYGTTEATLPKVYKRLRRIEGGTGNLAAGRPVLDTRICLIDPDRALDPPLVRAALENPAAEGEIVLVSRYVSHGYVGMTDETAARFADLGDGRIAYRTGDLGRIDAGGELTVLGRVDDEVKVNGVRIHPAEVAAAIRAGGVAGDVFVAVGSSGGLTAYVTPAGVDTAELRRQLAATLPTAMIPVRIVTLAALPLLPSGKVDRSALRDEPLPDEEHVAPAGEIESWLAGVMAELFGVDRVSASADFFAFGDSISAMRLTSRIRRELGVSLSVRDIFTASTITAIAREIADRQLLSVDSDELLAMLGSVEGVCSRD